MILERSVISHLWRLCGLLRAKLTLRRRETKPALSPSSFAAVGIPNGLNINIVYRIWGFSR
jgi:hypothetical protein